MHLWNDYEGKTIAEVYPLQKLLRPEGRSAFFLTTVLNGNNKGDKPDLIRLTESLNDEHEMLARWRQVSEVHQPNLVTIKTCGKTTCDGVRLTYALMESNDSSLDEILRERPLTPVETTEVAVSVAAALSALHDISLIHAHVEATNVLAVGEVIKLRSDCVRECISDPEFNPPARCQELRQQDIHDLGMLLLRCLTLDRAYNPATRLPAPFDRVIPRALDGSWSLAEITRVLTPTPVKPLVPEHVLASAGATQSAVAAPTAPRSANSPGESQSLGRTQARPSNSAPAPVTSQVAPVSSQATPATSQAARETADSTAEQIPLPLREKPAVHLHRVQANEPSPFRTPNTWLLMAAAALVLILGVWVFSGSKSSQPAPPVIANLDDAPGAHPAASKAAASSPAAVPAAQPAASSTPAQSQPTHPAGTVQSGWHVIAYTFNHENQAWTRIAAIQKRHPDLNPRLFHPGGRAPFYVAIGGAMSQNEAEATRNRARRLGLPRDTFARFYQSS